MIFSNKLMGRKYMRSFRSNRENLRDTRIVYTFLLSLALVCVLLVILVSVLSGGLHRRELEGYYESLTLCADALVEWSYAEDAEGRYSASLRFEGAVSGLPAEVSLEPLMLLVNRMRMGDTAKKDVTAYAETFAVLSSIEYDSTDDARRIISRTLESVNEEIGETEPPESTDLPDEQVLAYTRQVAERGKSELLGGALRTLDLELSEERGVWLAESENLRIEYSLSDGRLVGLVYIRVGVHPTAAYSEEERRDAALEFYNSVRGRSGGASVSTVRRMCGFTLCEVEDKNERWNICVDSHGRVWSFFRASE